MLEINTGALVNNTKLFVTKPIVQFIYYKKYSMRYLCKILQNIQLCY